MSHWIVNCWKKDPKFWAGKKIVELGNTFLLFVLYEPNVFDYLGSGTGLTGIVAALVSTRRFSFFVFSQQRFSMAPIFYLQTKRV